MVNYIFNYCIRKKIKIFSLITKIHYQKFFRTFVQIKTETNT